MRLVLRWLLIAVYLSVAVIHLGFPGIFLPIVPDWVPYPKAVIAFTGVCEAAGAISLMTVRLRYLAGIMLAAYAVCVYPANIKQAIDGLPLAGLQLGWWYHVPRLAFQPVFVWWALFAGGVVRWPFRKSAPPG